MSSRNRLIASLAAVLLAVLAAWWWWPREAPASSAPDPRSPEGLDARLLAAEQGLVRQQRIAAGLERRLADTEARAKVLRDELLGAGQRLALMEDTLRELGERDDDAVVAVRLQEIELLLVQAQARLQSDADVAGALRAYALADEVLARLTAAEWVSLRQSLAAEIRALKALPADPIRAAEGDLAALEAALPTLAVAQPTEPSGLPKAWWQRALATVVEIRPRGQRDLLAPQDQQRGETALLIELGVARAALQRRDDDAFRAALLRADTWLPRLYAPSPELAAERARLMKLQQASLALPLPDVGGTRDLLRQLQARRRVQR